MKMYNFKKILVFLGLLLPIILLVGCSKNEDVSGLVVESKNPVVSKIADDLNSDSIKKTVQWLQDNVIARFEGSSNIGKVYVIGAHYDSYCYDYDPFIMAPGADDNASGVAGMLEIARVIKKNGFVPKNTIEFVSFAAEEAWLKGSADYASKSAANSLGIALMINLEIVILSF